MSKKILNKLFFPIIFFRDLIVERFLDGLSEKKRFKLIYKSGYWKPFFGESYSGAGSSEEATINIRSELPIFFEKHKIKSILDIPCGDFYWMSKVNLNGLRYIGAEIVEDLVLKNQNDFSSENLSFIVCDLIKDHLPKADVVFVRDCLVHLEDNQIQSALSNIIDSGSKFLATTTYPDTNENIQPVNKDRWRSLNLTCPPFSLPKPLILLDDSWQKNPLDNNKKIGIWRIKDLQLG